MKIIYDGPPLSDEQRRRIGQVFDEMCKEAFFRTLTPPPPPPRPRCPKCHIVKCADCVGMVG